MTLPFRRRHNDAEASHDRARSLIGTSFLEPLEASEAAWLAAHLAGCPECGTEAAAYEEDRQLLRTLRDRPIEAPRDLWARTAAEIEQSRGRGERSTRPAGAPRSPRAPRFGRVPLGVMSGLLVVAVVIGVSLAPHGGPLPRPGGTDTAQGSQGAEATPIAVTADVLAWIQLSPDGSYEFQQANVNEVCVDPRDGCAPLNSRNSTRLTLTQAPQSVLLSPDQAHIAVVTTSTAASGSDIVVVTVPAVPPQAPSPVPTETAATTPPTAVPSPTASDANGTPAPTPTPSVAPSPSEVTPSIAPSGSPVPSASVEPTSGHAIVTGVVIVGDAAYSADGQWLAFSARPADGSSGPDLYTWHVGDEQANAVTSDHRTFFGGWLGAEIVANRVVPADAAPQGSGDPGASTDPASAPTEAPVPTATEATGSTVDPGATPAASQVVAQDHPVAFMFDPATDVATPLGGSDIWHPTFDPTGASVVYWAGTLVPDGTGTGWNLGAGHLVIDGWQDGAPLASDAASPSAVAGASAEPTAPPLGPAGHPVTLTEDPIAGFDAWFDPTGTRLAVWIADAADPTIGTLRLVVIDPATRQIDPTSNPLPGVAALRGVSINNGRLAWVTPPGQDGQGSHVQVLAWNGREFGQVRTIQGDRLVVAR